MPKKKVPCFTTDGLPHERYPEFDRQLAGQETGINDMTVDEYLKGRDLFESKSAVRDPKVARRARADHQAALTNELYERFRAEGMSKSQALSESAKKASEAMKTLAALHNPDMVAAGKDVISDFGDRSINSRIGAQWRQQERLAQLDKAANNVPEAVRSTVKMNAKLERCK